MRYTGNLIDLAQHFSLLDFLLVVTIFSLVIAMRDLAWIIIPGIRWVRRTFIWVGFSLI